MKVVGSGSPRMLTVRLKPCELPLLRDEVEEHQRSVLSSLADQRRSIGVGARHRDDERLKDDLVTLTRLLDELRGPVRPDQPLEVTGPTDVLGEVIRGAAGEAVYRLHEDVDRFREDRGTPMGSSCAHDCRARRRRSSRSSGWATPSTTGSNDTDGSLAGMTHRASRRPPREINYTAQRVLRALEVIVIAPASAPQVAHALGINARTARRILGTLQDEQYVEYVIAPRGRPRQRYVPTVRLLALAAQLAPACRWSSTAAARPPRFTRRSASTQRSPFRVTATSCSSRPPAKVARAAGRCCPPANTPLDVRSSHTASRGAVATPLPY
jgi:hypothetical protein